jgi:hypothetical protein
VDLLPLSFHGVFLHFDQHKFPELFARPSFSTGALAISGLLDFISSTDIETSVVVFGNGYRYNWQDYRILGHCNGLLLLDKYVVNPATRRYYPLPLFPLALLPLVYIMDDYVNQSLHMYLVYDPMVSPHYEVFLIPNLFSFGCDEGEIDPFDPLVEVSRWQSSPCVFLVFSSKTGNWEKRSFVREGDFPGTNDKFRCLKWQERAVYWRQALYLHRRADFVVRYVVHPFHLVISFFFMCIP